MEKGLNGNGKTGQTQDLKKPKGLLIVIMLAVIVILMLIGVIVYLLTKPVSEVPDDGDSIGNTRAIVVTEKNVEEVMSQTQEIVKDGYYNCQMNVDWSFTSSEEPSYNAYVANSKVNTRTVYFDVTLEADEELVYSSPFIPVGEELREITLDSKLPAGDYPAVVTYHLVDDDFQDLTTVSVAVTLHIEQ